MKTKVYIVDDDALVVAEMMNMLADMEEVEVVGHTTNPLTALDELGSGQIKVDITLLDIQMKQMSGLELAGLLYGITSIIFITAHSRFAVAAFDESHVIDYILKPVTPQRLAKGITRMRIRMENTQSKQPIFDDEFFFLKLDGKKRYVKVEKSHILYLEGAGNYTNVQLKGTKYLSHFSMGTLMDILSPKKFIKIQKSYVINLDHVERISGNDVQMSNGVHLLVGDVYRKPFYERLNLGGTTY